MYWRNGNYASLRPAGWLHHGVCKALHGRENQIRPVVPRDEQTASCMADMYGKLTGKPGVFAAQGGFAGSTGMFGVIEAYLAHSPMVVLTELSELDRVQCAWADPVGHRQLWIVRFARHLQKQHEVHLGRALSARGGDERATRD